ncbi:MAG: hypothetical protein MJY75_07755 [Bacteroidaceae bacterium]|nr:hypothetical protein [Bacteroidaceae bacterium]
MEFETSHGYEFTPHFYLGAGLGIHMFQEHESTFAVRKSSAELPFFANTRLTVGKGKLYAIGSNTLQDLLGFSFKIGYEF